MSRVRLFPIVVALVASFTSLRAEDDARAPLERGLTLQRAGKYGEAIEALRAASKLELPPELACEVLVELAETHFRRGKDASEDRLDEGEVADERADFAEAARIFAKAVELHPAVEKHSAYAAYMVGSSHLMLGDMTKAFEAYKVAYFEYKSSDHGQKALIRLGVTLAGMGQAEAAKKIFQTCIQEFRGDEKLSSNIKKMREYIDQLGMVGSEAPTLDADKWLHGNVSGGIDSLEDEVVVLVFFATWCKVCSKELPRIRREIEHFKDKGVVFIGVANPEDPDATEPVEFYVERNEVGFFDVALDAGGDSWRPYKVYGLPAAVIIDRDGIVRWRGHFTFMGRTLIEELISSR